MLQIRATRASLQSMPKAWYSKSDWTRGETNLAAEGVEDETTYTYEDDEIIGVDDGSYCHVPL